jgi:hypothetical protein
VIDSVFALGEARKAFERVAMRDKRGKVVLKVVNASEESEMGGSRAPADVRQKTQLREEGATSMTDEATTIVSSY